MNEKKFLRKLSALGILSNALTSTAVAFDAIIDFSTATLPYIVDPRVTNIDHIHLTNNPSNPTVTIGGTATLSILAINTISFDFTKPGMHKNCFLTIESQGNLVLSGTKSNLTSPMIALINDYTGLNKVILKSDTNGNSGQLIVSPTLQNNIVIGANIENIGGSGIITIGPLKSNHAVRFEGIIGQNGMMKSLDFTSDNNKVIFANNATFANNGIDLKNGGTIILDSTLQPITLTLKDGAGIKGTNGSLVVFGENNESRINANHLDGINNIQIGLDVNQSMLDQIKIISTANASSIHTLTARSGYEIANASIASYIVSDIQNTNDLQIAQDQLKQNIEQVNGRINNYTRWANGNTEPDAYTAALAAWNFSLDSINALNPNLNPINQVLLSATQSFNIEKSVTIQDDTYKQAVQAVIDAKSKGGSFTDTLDAAYSIYKSSVDNINTNNPYLQTKGQFSGRLIFDIGITDLNSAITFASAKGGSIEFNGQNINSPITTQYANSGNIVLNGNLSNPNIKNNMSINAPLGTKEKYLGEVKLYAGNFSLNSDMYSKQHLWHDVVIQVNNDVKCSGAIIIKGGSINVDPANILEFDIGYNQIQFKDFKVKIKGNIRFNISVDEHTNGMLDVNSNLSISDSIDTTESNIEIYVTDDAKRLHQGNINAPTTRRKYYVLGHNTDIFNKYFKTHISPNILVTSNNAFMTWDYADGVITATDISKDTALSLVQGSSNVDTRVVNVLFDPSNTGDTAKLAKDLAILGTMDSTAFVKALEKLTTILTTNAVIGQGITATTATITSGIATAVGTQGISALAFEEAGIAAGDVAPITRPCAWVKPLWMQGTQSQYGTNSGYKSDIYGAVLGFDAHLSDSLILGSAISALRSDINYQDLREGDNSQSNVYMASIYAVKQFVSNWFIQAIGSIGLNATKNAVKKLTSKGIEIAHSKYKNMLYQAECLMGYKGRVNKVSIVPMFGIGITGAQKYKYDESGTSFQNLTVSATKSYKVEGILGVSGSWLAFNTSHIKIEPELHGFVRHTLKNDSGVIQSSLGGGFNSKISPTTKMKTITNIGGTITIARDRFNTKFSLTLGYDYNEAYKYHDHQGSIKVNVQF